MANVPTAKIKISSGSSAGSGEKSGGGKSDESFLLTKVLQELKMGNGISSKALKLRMSGMMGGAAAGSIGVIGAMLAAIAGGGIGGGSERENDKQYGYEKIITPEGDKKIAKIDNETGKIVDLLTLEQAKHQGIVDELGNIKTESKVSSDLWTDNVKDLEDSAGWIMFSNKMWDEITAEQLKYKEAIAEAIRRLRRQRIEYDRNQPAPGTNPESVFNPGSSGGSPFAPSDYDAPPSQLDLSTYALTPNYLLALPAAQSASEQNYSTLPPFLELMYGNKL